MSAETDAEGYQTVARMLVDFGLTPAELVDKLGLRDQVQRLVGEGATERTAESVVLVCWGRCVITSAHKLGKAVDGIFRGFGKPIKPPFG